MRNGGYSGRDSQSSVSDGMPGVAGDGVCDDGVSAVIAIESNGNNGETVRGAFARNLREWRMGRNLPMKVVAFDIGVDESTYCLWESGKRFPNAENLDAIARYSRRPICMFFRNGGGLCVT